MAMRLEDLPRDLLSRIFILLPVSFLVRLLTVSRFFRDLLSSPSFHALLAPSRCRDPFFILYTDASDPSPTTALAFHPLTSRFLLLSIPKSHILLSTPSLAISDASTSFNFLSRSPPRRFTMVPSSFRAVAVIPFSPNFLILAVHHRGLERSLVYDSREQRWEDAGELDVKYSILTHTACVGRRVYVLARKPERLLLFDAETRQWDLLPTAMPGMVSSAMLFSWDGRLFVVDGVDYFGSIRSIVVREIDWESMEWLELCCMPPWLFREFAGSRLLLRSFSGVHGDGMVCLFNPADARAVIFDAAAMEWRRVPDSDLMPKQRQKWYGHAAVPSIDLLMRRRESSSQ